MSIDTEKTQQATINVGGMACSGCANAVQNALNNLEGVESVSVNLDEQSALLLYNANVVSADDFEKAVEDAGYEFKGVKS